MRAIPLLAMIACWAFGFSGLGIAVAQEPDLANAKDEHAAIETKLQGEWIGPPCGGDWVFRADGTFAVEHYSPGDNRLTGTWALRWNALPPTLILTLESSDAPNRIKVGETWEVKLVRLDDEALAYIRPQDPDRLISWKRAPRERQAPD